MIHSQPTSGCINAEVIELLLVTVLNTHLYSLISVF